MNYSPRYGLFRLLLRKIREEAGLSQLELSQKLKKPQTFVSKSEIGERRIDFIETLDFCEACGVPMARFVKRLEEMQNEKVKPRGKRKSPRMMDAEGRMIDAGSKTENDI
jgi:transcriptional regulator with XRE-family HTH domain